MKHLLISIFSIVANRLYIQLLVQIIILGNALAVPRENIEYGHDCTKRCFPADIKDPLVCRRVSTDISVCACADGLFRHDTMNRCVAPTGGACTTKSSDGLPITTCTEFAVCWSTEKNDPTVTRQNGTCHCEPDSKAGPHAGLCKLKFGANRCNKIGDCDVMAGLNCNYRKCACRDQQFHTYNQTSGKCEALAGGECGVANHPFPAVECTGPHMKCVKGKCLCLKGYGKTVQKKCIELTETTYVSDDHQGRPVPFYGGAGGGRAHMKMAKMASKPAGLAEILDTDQDETADESDGEGSAADKTK